jgi:soluble lytic murein transglycosylase-like protein
MHHNCIWRGPGVPLHLVSVRRSLRYPSLFGLVVVLATLATPARADIYSYTDADGVVHFTNITPSGAGQGRWTKIYKTGPGKAGAQRGSCERCDVVPARDSSAARFSRYDDYIHEASQLYAMPEPFIRAVIHVESSYDPRVVSSAGARGLMQLMPSVIHDMRVDDPHDPRANIMGGTRLLRILANKYDGDIVLTIAAYHAGAANVARWGGVPPYETTQKYVKMVLGQYYRYKEKRTAGKGGE